MQPAVLARHGDLVVRLATPLDRDALYEVCLRTGDAGNDATHNLVDGSLYGHVYAGPYLALAPHDAIVADDHGEVVGYALGAVDTATFEARCEATWWPPLRDRYPLPGSGTAIDRHLVELIHRPHATDARLVDRYPSHLHIDLLPRVQGQGLGRALTTTLLQRFRSEGSRGVHLGVDPRNTHALGFYEHLGLTRHDVGGAVLFTHRFHSEG